MGAPEIKEDRDAGPLWGEHLVTAVQQERPADMLELDQTITNAALAMPQRRGNLL